MEPVQSPQGPVQQPAANPQPTPAKTPNGLGIAALVVGIIAFCFGWAAVFGIIVGAVAVILGIVALKKKQNKTMGVLGIVFGAIALITSLIVTMLAAAVLTNAPAITEQINQQVQEQQKSQDAEKDKLVISNTSYKDVSGLKEVVGEIKNTTDSTHSATLKATFYDESGKILGTAAGSVSDVAAGETKTFNLFTSDEVAGYKELKVQVDTLL